MRRPALILAALAAAALPGCGGEVAPNTTGYSDRPVVQGGACFARNRKGQLVRVAPSNCPELAAPEEGQPAE